MSGQNGHRPVLGENVWLASLKAGALSGQFFTMSKQLRNLPSRSSMVQPLRVSFEKVLTFTIQALLASFMEASPVS